MELKNAHQRVAVLQRNYSDKQTETACNKRNDASLVKLELTLLSILQI